MPADLMLPPPAAPVTASEAGGAGAPELAKMTTNGRVYTDPLPWCPLLGALGIPEEGFEIGAEFGSVTTLLNYLPKDRLVAWQAKQAALCAVEDDWVLPLFGETIAVWWYSEAGNRQRDKAGTRGTMIHDVAEDGDSILRLSADALLAGKGIDPRFLEDANVAAYVKGLQKFFAAYPGIIPLWTEVTVFSRQFGYAGTLDLIGWIPGIGLMLVDWKASKYVLSKFSMQGAAYRHADYAIAAGRRLPLPTVDGFVIVHIMPGEDNEGAFEVIPVDSQYDIAAEVMPAMHAVKRWDHPSRIGKPIEPASLMADTMVAPNFTILSTADVAAKLAAKYATADQVVELCRDPYQRVEGDRFTMREWKVDYCIDRAKALREAADGGNAAAHAALVGLGGWLQQQGVPRFDSVELVESDAWLPVLDQQCESLSKAETQFSLPFGMARPQEIDFDNLLGQYIDDQADAEGTGLIEWDDRERRFKPAPMRPQLPRGAVTLLRRGREVSADDWSKPRDPEAAALEAELIERAAALPSDLLAALEAWAKQIGMPNLRMGVANDEQLRVTAAKIDELCDVAQRRAAAMRQRIARVFDVDNEADRARLSTLLDALDLYHEQPHTMTEAKLQLLDLGLEAVERGAWQVVADSEGEAGEFGVELLVSVDDAKAKGGPFGGARAFLTAAKAVAADFGRPNPKSTDDVFADAVLVALTFARQQASADSVSAA